MSRVKAGIYGLCMGDRISGSGQRWGSAGSMTLCLAQSIGPTGELHTHDVMDRFCQWLDEGAYTADGQKIGPGHTSMQAIDRYRRGEVPALCGGNRWEDNGDGSVARILPLAFVIYGKYGLDFTASKAAMELIHKVSALTHRHPLAQSACGIYISIACHILAGKELKKALFEGINQALDWYCGHARFREYLYHWDNLRQWKYRKDAPCGTRGYVADSLENAVWCLRNSHSFDDCILQCAHHDRGNIMAITCGLAGLYYGWDGISQDRRENLPGREVIDGCIQGLEAFCMENSRHEMKEYWDYTPIRESGRQSQWNTDLDRRPMKKNLDKFRGCLIGGAAGDALGYAVEFLSEKRIWNRYGEDGIQEYERRGGKALISDDTQMTLFTANGLLYAHTRGRMRGILGPYPGYVATAYKEWYLTQECSYPAKGDFFCSWLMNVPELFSPRAPGNTCMSAIENGCRGTIEEPTNSSKGCGGVMRVAPVGLYFGDCRASGMRVDLMAADIAALTHGHEMGYIPAALLAHIVRLVSHSEDITLREAVLDGLDAMERIFPKAEHMAPFRALMEKAVALSGSDTPDLVVIHTLGEGWVGDEALAIAVYCALKHSDDFDKCMIAAVNHRGDSDSTGAIAGNILGAYLGLSRIPQKYIEDLELKDVILEIAEDLYYDCQIDEYTRAQTIRDKNWERKYIYVDYPTRRAEDEHGTI